MLKLVRTLSPQDDGKIPQKDQPCQTCYGLDHKAVRERENSSGYGPSRLGFSLTTLKAAVAGGCRSCTILLRGLENLGSVTFLSESHTQDLHLIAHVTDQQPLRLKIYKPGEAHPLGEYELFTALKREPSFPAFGPADELSRDALCTENIKLMKGWIADCHLNHTRCETSNDEILPKRVICVGETQQSRPWLEETLGDKKGRYVALSHCWGTNIPLTTTRATLERRKVSIEWSLLPRTFQDAIRITRALGISYLWIDSLCIVQDDDEDWAENAAKMGNIFEGSYVTISATSAFSSEEGCFLLRKIGAEQAIISSSDVPWQLRTPVHVRPFRGSSAHSWLTTAEPDAKHRRYAPILSRGWCFQERLLASRVVHFTRDELVFECKTGCRCECGGADPLSLKALYVPLLETRPSTSERQMSVQELSSEVTALSLGLNKQRWRMLIEHYSTRSFTYLRDTLPALSAIARRYVRAPDDTYLAGLWGSQLPWDLLWYSKGGQTCHRPLERTLSDESALERADSNQIYTAPTFSWASRVGPVTWIASYDTAKPTARITETKCTPRSHDVFGEVEDGYVKIRGPTLPYSVKLFDPPGSPPFTSLLRNCTNGSCHFDTDEGEGIAREYPLRLMCVAKDERKGQYRSVDVATALILRPSKARVGTYRRVGILAWCDATIFEGTTEMEVTIV